MGNKDFKKWERAVSKCRCLIKKGGWNPLTNYDLILLLDIDIYGKLNLFSFGVKPIVHIIKYG